MANSNDTTTGKPVEVSNVIKADVNFTVIKGDTFDVILIFYDASGQPVSFAGATLLMMIRDFNDVEVETLQAGSEFVVSGNTLTFNYIPNYGPDTFYYDLQCTFSSGLRKTLIGGKFKVLKQITTL